MGRNVPENDRVKLTRIAETGGSIGRSDAFAIEPTSVSQKHGASCIALDRALYSRPTDPAPDCPPMFQL